MPPVFFASETVGAPLVSTTGPECAGAPLAGAGAAGCWAGWLGRLV